MRVGILGLIQESNTFLAGRTTLEHFREDVLATGTAVAETFAGAHHEIGGFSRGWRGPTRRRADLRRAGHPLRRRGRRGV